MYYYWYYYYHYYYQYILYYIYLKLTYGKPVTYTCLNFLRISAEEEARFVLRTSRMLSLLSSPSWLPICMEGAMFTELATRKDALLGAALETIREEVVLCSVLLMRPTARGRSGPTADGRGRQPTGGPGRRPMGCSGLRP